MKFFNLFKFEKIENIEKGEWDFLREQQALYADYMRQHPIRKRLAIYKARNYLHYINERNECILY